MSSALDKSLDDVIASRPKNKRRISHRKSAKATLVGTNASTATKTATRARKTGQTQNPTQAAAPHSQKIIISNLPLDVNEGQIKELFTQSIGPTKEVTLHHDNNGRSKGVASVIFTRSGDGTRACQEYNGRLIDGKRPMKVEIVLDPSKTSYPTLSQRVGPAPTLAAGAATAKTPARSKKGTRGRVGGKKGSARPNKSAADLDAEMADYTGATPAAAT